MTVDRDISIIFSTHNRSRVLRSTLEAMCEVERSGLQVEIVVVDNNSTDDTAQVIGSFADRLPLLHLFEPSPGKNRALNHALENADLGKIVIFTDDDVVPKANWLTAVIGACERWPEYSVFGGKIELIWPTRVAVPDWVHANPEIWAFMFSYHDRGDSECEYASGDFPFGPNFWVRRTVFDGGRRYAESIGPRPGGYAMGGETSFLRTLATSGYQSFYIPGAIVGHRVQSRFLSIINVLKRALKKGRGRARVFGMPAEVLFRAHPYLWRIQRVNSAAKALARVAKVLLPSLGVPKVTMACRAFSALGFHLESLSMASQGARFFNESK